MTLQEALDALKSLGNESVRVHNRKFGAGDNQYGAKLGDIRKLAATMKADHQSAMDLYDSGIIDAQLLAVLLIKPKKLSLDELDRIVRAATFSQVADWVNAYLVKEHPEKEALRVRWMADADPWAARAGWGLTSGRVARSPEGIDLTALLDRIEAEMPTAPAPTQWTMNSCLANIGIHHPVLRKRALAIGERLGIYRDYPVSKGCTSPFAPIWINEMVRRQG
ncbi:MAG: DNA alkylation repair protein [Gemmatimonadales bacterium]|nr:DNA alkylation repair protein [Gemmatimonadales bacterium]MBP6570424.1 DNA alkylation repair protein [Gemmatimonadales bacterium]MBP7619787.1 DNA alkylation repair protein [Gemmatimonadales bacterium]